MQQPHQPNFGARRLADPPVTQTRSFLTIALIELWERFGYYGMQALIVYFMVQRLGFDDTRATLVWGAAAALIYVAPAIGGWIGDKVLGTRRCMIIGAIILSLGYALMGIPVSGTWLTFAALGVIVVGNGLFKPNTANLVRKIYEGDDAKIDSAFTIYYMAVNVGSTVSMLATPAIKDHFNATSGGDLGWHMAFAVCSVGLWVGLLTVGVLRRTVNHIGSPPDELPLNWGKLALVLGGGVLTVIASTFILEYQWLARLFVYVAGLVVLGIFIHLIRTSQASERAGLAAALVLTLQTVFFFIFYQQMSTSLSLFALRNVDLDFSLFGSHLFTWSPAQFQALNAIWIMVLSPVLAWIYTRSSGSRLDLSIAAKFALGFAVVAAGFFTYGFAGAFAVNGLTSSWIMIAGYGLYSLGELLVSGLGLAMIARYVPARMGGFMMGAYFVAVGISQYLGGLVATMASVPEGMLDPLQTLPIYTSLFNKLGLAAIACTFIALAALPLMRRLTAAHHAHA
ncbi:peptide MFS transporter [Massilia timonae]|uniref:Amino acid/peptide transporter (Peptide:H+ symporter) n=1 Tax=Massilia timonae CCUG 45783 TaxID=883126 RepID=K9DTC5_9BURK|nr:oligopeptide:H+ symporter [Massilia timonae]EKU81927.1 amino acid/peptide transporter (Peptide:H+ symporter) [Massilia timonae CCUG 45783]